MIALLEAHQIAFVASPKCMTTSIGRMFLEIETQKPFDRKDHGGHYVHRVYKIRAKALRLGAVPAPLEKLKDYWTFTVVRDPIKRLLSAYANRVVDQNEVGKVMARPAWQAEHGETQPDLEPRPDPSEFFENLALYRDLIPSIRHHTNPMRDYLGSDLSAYDAVFPVENITDLEQTLSERIGSPLKLPNAQRSKSKLKFADLSPAAQNVIREFTRSDYELLSDWYRPEDVLGSVTALQESKA